MEEEQNKPEIDNDGWVTAKGRFKVEPGWRDDLKKKTGYIARPKFVRIHPDRKKKKVMIKNLYNAGWSSRILAIWFKTKIANVSIWAKKETPDGLKEFEKQFQMAMKADNMKGVAMVADRLMELIPGETKIESLVKAGEFFRGTTAKGQNLTQVNVYQDLVKKFSPQGIEEEYK